MCKSSSFNYKFGFGKPGLTKHRIPVLRQALSVRRHFMADIIHYSDFKTLRLAYIEVKTFVEQELGDEVESLNTKLESDLGCAGDDNLELLEKFVTQYKLSSAGFDYSKHFLSEGELFGSSAAFLTLISIPIHLVIWIVKIITFGKVDFTRRQILPDWERKTIDLTFGDMVTWYLTGTYNLRQKVHVQLKNDA